MATAKRIYRVTDAENTEGFQLVRAASQAQAIGAVVANRYSARTASQDDIVDGLSAGAVVLDTKGEDAPAAEAGEA